MGQEQAPVTNTRVLIGVDHSMIVRFAPRIPGFRLAVLAQLLARVHRLAELANELLGGLGGDAGMPGCRDAGIPPLGPALPACLAWPPPAQPAKAVVTYHQVAPQPCRLFAAGGERGPFSCRAWHPRNFYRAI